MYDYEKSMSIDFDVCIIIFAIYLSILSYAEKSFYTRGTLTSINITPLAKIPTLYRDPYGKKRDNY